MTGSAPQCASHFNSRNWLPRWGRSGPGVVWDAAMPTTLRRSLLGIGFIGLLIPVLYLWWKGRGLAEY